MYTRNMIGNKFKFERINRGNCHLIRVMICLPESINEL